jgi:hypothetical protein
MEAKRLSLCREDSLPMALTEQSRLAYLTDYAPPWKQSLPKRRKSLTLFAGPKEFQHVREMRENRMNRTATSRTAFRYWVLFLFSSSYLFLFLRVLWRVGDEGLVVYGAQRVAEGALPYRDFIEAFGPASFYWHTFFFSFLGTKWFVARGVLLFTGATSAVLIYWMTRRLYRGPFEMMPSLFCLVLGIPLWPASNHHWDSNLFALLAVGMFLLWQEKGRTIYLVMSGVTAGITSCFIQQKGLLLLASFFLTLFLFDKRSTEKGKNILKHTGLLVACYMGVGGILFLYFHIEGGLQDLVYSTFLWPLANYHNVNITPYGYGLFEFYWPSWLAFFQQFFPESVSKGLSSLFLVPFVVLLSLPILIAVLTVISCRIPSNRPRIFHSAMITFLCSGLALWISEMQRMDIFHVIYGAPLLLIACLGVWIPGHEKTKWFRMSVLYVIAFCLLSFGIFNGMIASTANHRIETRRGIVYCLRDDSALHYLQENTHPGEHVFVYPYYPMYYFLANIKNPTRYNNLIYGYHTGDQFREVISDLERKKVKLILWDTLVEGKNLKTWFPRYEHPPEEHLILEHYLRDHYDMIGVENGFRILRRRGQ